MKNSNSFGVHFMVRKERGDGINAPIYAVITVNKVRRECSLRHQVPINKWNNRKGLAKAGSTEMDQLNTELEEERATITAIYRDLCKTGELVNTDLVKARYQGTDTGPTPFTVKVLMVDYERDQKSKLAIGSWKNYKTTYQYLTAYMENEIGAKDILVQRMDAIFLDGYCRYVREHPKKRGKPATQNGIAKHVERINRMVNWAKEKKIIPLNPIEDYKVKKKKFTRKYISEQELWSLEEMELNLTDLDYARDLFVFGCYTGIGYGDLLVLGPQDLRVTEDGLYWNTHFDYLGITGNVKESCSTISFISFDNGLRSKSSTAK